MSITMAKGEGVTVFTVASNPKSPWPLLCQVLGTLCYSPVCCSVSQAIRKVHGSSMSALGVLQIMTGLFNFGLGAFLCSDSSTLYWFSIPYLLGSFFVLSGVLCILAEKFPSRCLLGINVLMSLAVAALAVTGIVMYALDLSMQNWYRMQCEDDYYSYRQGSRYWYETTTQSNEFKALEMSYLEECLKKQKLISMIFRGLDAVLIILCFLQLCVNISSAVLGLKALIKGKEDMNDIERHKPLLKDVTCNAPD